MGLPCSRAVRFVDIRRDIGLSTVVEDSGLNALREAERVLSSMTRAEKAQLLQWVVSDLGDSFPGIESTPDVCGGEARIIRTRIPVWVLEQARRLGVTEADLLRSYPTLRAEDLVHAWAYARAHREEIERQRKLPSARSRNPQASGTRRADDPGYG